MVELQNIKIQQTSKSKLPSLDFSNLPFGKFYSDHMYLVDYRQGRWQDPRIIPFGYLPMSPATPALHYGHSIFEGLKAYRSEAGEALVFRPLENWKRMNRSADRMAMVNIPEEVYMEGLRTLLDLEREWIPGDEGASLYIRPTLFSADEFIGIRPSRDFTFMIILSPVGAYYSDPVKVKIETHYTRAVAGGTGFAKAGGNYGGSVYPAMLAQEQGYHQLIWTDGKEHAYLEESGTMNLMFVFGDTLVTPPLSDSILAGITRDSVLTLAREWGVKTEERKISVLELIEKLEEGLVSEAFGVGTAATIAHLDAIGYEGKNYALPPVSTRTFSNRVFAELEGIKRGKIADRHGWVMKI